MKLSRSDLIALGTSAAVITLSSVLLYLDFTRKIEVKNVRKIGTISFKREVAQRRYLSQVVWEDVEQNIPVYNNDSVRTSDNSEAVIHLNDGTDISIDENSMIQLSSLESGININFNHGSMSANRQGVAGGKELSSINIISNDSTVSINRSNIQLTQLANQELDLTVSDGAAKIKAGNKETIVKQNEKAIISSDRKKAEIVKLHFDLVSPEINKHFLTSDRKSPVNFSWKVDGSYANFRIDVSTDRGFKRSVYSSGTGSSNSLNVKLGEGAYYWRVSANNKQSGAKEFSPIGRFNIIYHEASRLISPEDRQAFKSISGTSDIDFKWSRDTMAEGYTLELSRDSAFSKIEKSVSTTMQNISIASLSLGDYYWRVKSDSRTLSGNASAYSNTGRFSVSQIRELPAPGLIKPSKNSKIDILESISGGIIFSWNAGQEKRNFDVIISHDPEFKKIAGTYRVNTNYKLLGERLNIGRYYWKVKTITETGNIPDSEIFVFDMVSNAGIELFNPKTENFLIETGKSVDVTFQWKSTVKNLKSRIDISRDPKFKSFDSHVHNASDSRKISFSEKGDYYWRVSLLDKDGAAIISSKISQFNLSEKISVASAKKSVIEISSPVRGSRIYIDEKFSGTDSVRKTFEPGRELKISVRAPEFRNYETTLTLKDGQNYTIRAVMIKKKLLGRVKWASPLLSPAAATPVVHKNRIVVVTESGELKILTTDGALLISKKLSEKFESEPAVSGNTIYAVDINGTLYSVSLSSGAVNWKVRTGAPLIFGSKPVLDKGLIYLASGYGIVQCYNLKGKQVWKVELDEGIYSTARIYKDKLIVITDAEKIYALSTKDGDEDWSEKIDGRVARVTPEIYGGLLYFGTDSGQFYAMNPKNGDLVWSFKAQGSVYSTPLIIDGRIYFGTTSGHVYALDSKSGSKIWQKTLNKPVKSSVISAFGLLIVNDANTVYALNTAGGKLQWQQSFESSIATSPVYVSDTVVMGLANGEVVSVRNNLLQTIK